MVQIASRASWGARYRDGDLTLPGLATEVFVHHTVTAHLSASATVAQERAQMRHIESIGQSRFGTGISYNVVIFPSGRAYQGVSWNRRGTHTGGRNSTTRSICYAGNYETRTPTAAALETGAAILARGRNRWWTRNAPLRGHRDVSSTACPGRHLYSRLGQIRSRSAYLVSNPGGGPGNPNIPTPGGTLPTPPREVLSMSDINTILRRLDSIAAAVDKASDHANKSKQGVGRIEAGDSPVEVAGIPISHQVWGHNHPQDQSTDMGGYILSTYRLLAQVKTQLDAVAEALDVPDSE